MGRQGSVHGIGKDQCTYMYIRISAHREGSVHIRQDQCTWDQWTGCQDQWTGCNILQGRIGIILEGWDWKDGIWEFTWDLGRIGIGEGLGLGQDGIGKDVGFGKDGIWEGWDSEVKSFWI